MSRLIRLFCSVSILVLLTGVWLAETRPAAACEVYLPPNYRYTEEVIFDQTRFPEGLAINMDRPQWVIDGGLVGFVQLENRGAADLILLFAFDLGSDYASLEDGSQIDNAILSRGLVIKPGDTFDMIGEGNLIEFAPEIKGFNSNNPQGDPLPAGPDPLPVQSGNLYFVSNRQLNIVPFTLSYAENPAYKPEGTFHIFTLEERVAQAAVIVQGVAETAAPDGNNTLAAIRVERWLKGNGPAKIFVGDFVNTSCDYQISAGEERIFFLRAEGEIYRLNNLQVGMFDAWERPEEAGQIITFSGQEPFLPTADSPADPNSVSATAAAGSGDPLLWLFVTGPIALLAGIYLWRRQNGRR